MKTIEELVRQLAENTGAKKPETKKQTQKITSVPKEIPAPAADRGQTDREMRRTAEPERVRMTLDIAKCAAEAAECAARIVGVSVVTAIVDEGARLVLLHAMDGSYIASVRAAEDKAYTAAALKMPTHTALRESRGGALDGLTNGNGILLLGGGFPLREPHPSGEGRIYGGIGVSGGSKEQDTLIAAVAAEILRIRLEKEA